MAGADRAQALIRDGHWAEAADLLGRLVAADSGRTVSRTFLLAERGRCLHRAALGEYTKREGAHLYALGSTLFNRGERLLLEEARVALQDAVADDDGGILLQAEARARLGEVLMDLGRAEEARPHLFLAALADPTEPRRVTDLGADAALLMEWSYATRCFAISAELGRDPHSELPDLVARAAEGRDTPPKALRVFAHALFFRDFNTILLGLVRDLDRAVAYVKALSGGPLDRFQHGTFGIVPLTFEEAGAHFPQHANALSSSEAADTLPFTPEEAARGEPDPALGMRLYMLGASLGRVDPAMVEHCRWAGRRVDWDVVPPAALGSIPALAPLASEGLVLGRFAFVPVGTTEGEVSGSAWDEFRTVRDILSRMGIMNPSHVVSVDITEVLLVAPGLPVPAEAAWKLIGELSAEPGAVQAVVEEAGGHAEGEDIVRRGIEAVLEETETRSEVDLGEGDRSGVAWEGEGGEEREGAEGAAGAAGEERQESLAVAPPPPKMFGPTPRAISPLEVASAAEAAWAMAEEGRYTDAAKAFGMLAIEDGGRTLSKGLMLAEMGRCLYAEARKGLPDLGTMDLWARRTFRPDAGVARLIENAATAFRGAVAQDDGGRDLLGDTLERLSSALLDLGQPKEALGHLSRAIMLDPTDTDRPVLLGLASALDGEWRYAHVCFDIASAIGRDPSAEVPAIRAAARERAGETPLAWSADFLALYVRDFDIDLLGFVRDVATAREFIASMRAGPFERYRRCAIGIVPLNRAVAQALFPEHVAAMAGAGRRHTLPFTPEEARAGALDPTQGLGLYFIGATLGDVAQEMVGRVHRAARRVDWSIVPEQALAAIPELSNLPQGGLAVGRFETMAPRLTQSDMHDLTWVPFHRMREAMRHMGVPNSPRIETHECTSPMRARARDAGGGEAAEAWVDWDRLPMPLGPF
jgi:tetratricopeptide (TPR) repeat protein